MVCPPYKHVCIPLQTCLYDPPYRGVDRRVKIFEKFKILKKNDDREGMSDNQLMIFFLKRWIYLTGVPPTHFLLVLVGMDGIFVHQTHKILVQIILQHAQDHKIAGD